MGGMKIPLVAGVLAVAVAVPVGYNIHKGQQEKVHLIQAQIAEEQATQAAQAELAAMLQQIEQYRKRLPSQPNPAWLATEVVSLGEQSGLRFTSIAQEPPRAVSPQFTRLAVTLEFSASYHQLGSFLDRVEHSDHVIRVEHLEVTSPREKWGQAAIKLVVSTGYLPPVVKGTGG